MVSNIEIGGLTFTQPVTAAHREILSEDACLFVCKLVDEFRAPLADLLQKRAERQAEFDAGKLPDFLPETAEIRESDWKIAPLPEILLDRRLEITAPVDRKTVINALNAEVQSFMADFEDSFSPTWEGILDGQANLRDAATGKMEHVAPETGKKYQLTRQETALVCRVRGLHLSEKHVLREGGAIPGCLLDFGLYLFHNAKTLQNRGRPPCFYFPKLQSHLEARWWNAVIEAAQKRLGLSRGTVRVSCLIETLPAVFEMDEILYELKDHAAALNCGRWDYIFSYIKTLRMHGDRLLPDRRFLTMDKPFLNAYSRALVRVCHRRGALAMGGMANFIPQKDEAVNAQAMAKVTADKELEVKNGHDGAWIAHPGLVSTVGEVFRRGLNGAPNQLEQLREEDAPVSAAELLAPPPGERTVDGVRVNIRIALQYIEAWISGVGCVPIYGLMEDAATAEISRSLIWQWLRAGAELDGGEKMSAALFDRLLDEEMSRVRGEIGEARFDGGRFVDAKTLLRETATAEEFAEFLTLPAYDYL